MFRQQLSALIVVSENQDQEVPFIMSSVCFKTINDLNCCVTKNDLSNFLNVSSKQLDFLSHVNYRKVYTCFNISKKTKGEVRKIYAPTKKLKRVQRIIKEYLQKCYLKNNGPAMGMEPGTSIKKNALCHVGKKYVINIDLSNFFETIHIGRVIGLFKKSFSITDELAVILAQLATCDRVLATGSPCSPVIADMIFYKADKAIKKYIKLKDITYTRYADDLTFSFDDERYINLFFRNQRRKELNTNFANIINNSGFYINESKTRLQNKYMHQQVTGVKVNVKLNLRRKFVSEIRAQLFFAKKYGINSTASFRFKSVEEDEAVKKWKRWIVGKISYLGMVRGIEDYAYARHASVYNEIVGKRVFSLQSTDITTIGKLGVSFATMGIDDTSGTCFFYRGKMITCFHCLEVMEINEKIASFLNNPLERRKRKAKLLFSDESADVAVFEPLFNDYVELVASPLIGKIPQNTKIIALGYPSYDNSCPNDTEQREGKVTSHRFLREKGITLNSTDISLETGFSGGPVVNKSDGKLLGMIVYGNKDKELSTIQNGFISLQIIDDIIDRLG